MYYAAVLALLCVVGCRTSDPVGPAGTGLDGTWAGTYETTQAGNCTWGSEASVATTAVWQLTNTNLTGTVTKKVNQTLVTVQWTGTLTGSKVSVSEAINGRCNGVARQYATRYTGDLNGNKLTLTGYDTICPVERCIFLKTVNLTRQ